MKPRGHTAIVTHFFGLGKVFCKVSLVFLCLVGVLLPSSCARPGAGTIELPTGTALPRFPPWAVVQVMYARGYAEPQEGTKVAAMFRGGEVVALLGRTRAKVEVGGVLDYWYQIDGPLGKSWIFGSQLLPVKDETTAAYEAERVTKVLFP